VGRHRAAGRHRAGDRTESAPAAIPAPRAPAEDDSGWAPYDNLTTVTLSRDWSTVRPWPAAPTQAQRYSARRRLDDAAD
jgi:hypothetical protein